MFSVLRSPFVHCKVIPLSFLIALFSLLIVSCPDGAGSATGGSDSGGGSGSDLKLPEEVDVVYSVTNQTTAKTYTDFSYRTNGSNVTTPLSNWINGSPSVTIINSKLTIHLDVPKPSSLSSAPSNAKIFDLGAPFLTSDSKYALRCFKDNNNVLSLSYADKDFKYKATENRSGETYIIDISFKKGWNYQIYSLSGSTVTVTSSQTLPGGFNWTVMDNS